MNCSTHITQALCAGCNGCIKCGDLKAGCTVCGGPANSSAMGVLHPVNLHIGRHLPWTEVWTREFGNGLVDLFQPMMQNKQGDIVSGYIGMHNRWFKVERNNRHERFRQTDFVGISKEK